MTTSPSDTHYIDAYFFEGTRMTDHKVSYYPEEEAVKMFQRVINKYKGKPDKVFLTLRTIDHELIKSEKINL